MQKRGQCCNESNYSIFELVFYCCYCFCTHRLTFTKLRRHTVSKDSFTKYFARTKGTMFMEPTYNRLQQHHSCSTVQKSGANSYFCIHLQEHMKYANINVNTEYKVKKFESHYLVWQPLFYKASFLSFL